MKDIIFKALATIITALVPLVVKNVMIQDTVLEYVLSTRKEKVLKEVLATVFLMGMLVGLLFAGRILGFIEARVEYNSEVLYDWVLPFATVLYLVCILIGAISFLVAGMRKKKKKENKLATIYGYVLMFSMTLIPMWHRDNSFIYYEIFIYAYMALVSALILKYLAFGERNVDEALYYFIRERKNEINDSLICDKIYIYHKFSNNKVLCGYESTMKEPYIIIDEEDLYKKQIKSVKTDTKIEFIGTE